MEMLCHVHNSGQLSPISCWNLPWQRPCRVVLVPLPQPEPICGPAHGLVPGVHGGSVRITY
eukprot:15214194-Heterocapsa_arctica.AAC.1